MIKFVYFSSLNIFKEYFVTKYIKTGLPNTYFGNLLFYKVTDLEIINVSCETNQQSPDVNIGKNKESLM